MDSSSHDSNLKTGSKLDLPYWLVKSIYNEKYKFVSIILPKAYNKFNNEILEADPCVVDLRKMGPHYYDFGVLLVNLVDIDTALAISKSLLWVTSMILGYYFNISQSKLPLFLLVFSKSF